MKLFNLSIPLKIVPLPNIPKMPNIQLEVQLSTFSFIVSDTKAQD